MSFLRQKLPSILFMCLIVGAVGWLSGFFTTTSMEVWYVTLKKPEWSPPNFIFGPVWSVLYILMGISGGLVLSSDHPLRRKTLTWFLIQLVFNGTWSVAFFYLQSPLLGGINSLLLWGFVAWLLSLCFKMNRLAAWLLVPYFLWVSFANALNWSLWTLNRG